jgi:hypothetical protein
MILLIGFPKSGTSSFQKLFADLGHISYHHRTDRPNQLVRRFIGTMIRDNKLQGKPLLGDFLETDTITQMDVCVDKSNAYWPQITDFRQLYYENPTAVFILNTRDPDKLLQSFKKWNDLHGRMIRY